MRLFAAALLAALFALPAHALEDKDLSLEMSRYDQVIGKLQDQNEQLMSQVRQLQRDNASFGKGLQAAQGKVDMLSDQLQQMQNVNVRNIEAAQKQLNQKMNATDNNALDWGSKTRDCTDLGVKHQQIKTVTKPDGSKTVRFLCFDGKALHLGTELHDPAD
jgi:hypothetical protein